MMIDFGIDKMIILKIMDEFTQKYNYMTSSNQNSLFGIFSNDKEEIEKLRKESNPTLENIKEISDGNIEENNIKVKLKEENLIKEEDKIQSPSKQNLFIQDNNTQSKQFKSILKDVDDNKI